MQIRRFNCKASPEHCNLRLYLALAENDSSSNPAGPLIGFSRANQRNRVVLGVMLSHT